MTDRAAPLFTEQEQLTVLLIGCRHAEAVIMPAAQEAVAASTLRLHPGTPFANDERRFGVLLQFLADSAAQRPVVVYGLWPRGIPHPCFHCLLESARPFFRLPRPLPFDSIAAHHRTRPTLRAPVPSWRVYQEVPHGYLH